MCIDFAKKNKTLHKTEKHRLRCIIICYIEELVFFILICDLANFMKFTLLPFGTAPNE